MPFNITDFKGNFPFDGARPNLFEVNIPVFDQKLTFTAKSAQLPGSTLGTIEIPYFGRTVKVAGAISWKNGWQELTVTKVILLKHSIANIHLMLKFISMVNKETLSSHILSLICSQQIFHQSMSAGMQMMQSKNTQ